MASKNFASILPALGKQLTTITREIPSKLGAQDVLVRNHTVAINPIDGKRQELGILTPTFPSILGSDSAGTVVSVGTDVTQFKAGDRVLSISGTFVPDSNDWGAFQTYRIAPSNAVSKIPDNISNQGGATLPTAIATAVSALFVNLGIPLIGDKAVPVTSTSPILLVWGGASSVGSLTIQLARLAGLTVYTSASPRHHEYLRGLGASVLADYHTPEVAIKTFVDAAKKAGKPITYGLDTRCEKETFKACVQILEVAAAAAGSTDLPKLAHTVPFADQFVGDEKIQHTYVHAEELMTTHRELSVWLFHEKLPGWLETKAVVPNRYRVIEGGLENMQAAIDVVNKGVSGEKILVDLD